MLIPPLVFASCHEIGDLSNAEFLEPGEAGGMTNGDGGGGSTSVGGSTGDAGGGGAGQGGAMCTGCQTPICHDVGCDGGLCTYTQAQVGPAPATVPCDMFCNDIGECVECIESIDCPTQGHTCLNYVCVPPSCTNAMTDGAETDLNCGGGVCPKCGNGLICNIDEDCASDDCDNGICVGCVDHGDCDPTTEFCDGNGDCVPKLPDDEPCNGDEECLSGDCSEGKCD